MYGIFTLESWNLFGVPGTALLQHVPIVLNFIDIENFKSESMQD